MRAVVRRAVPQGCHAELPDQTEILFVPGVVAALFHLIHTLASGNRGIAVLDSGREEERRRHDASSLCVTTRFGNRNLVDSTRVDAGSRSCFSEPHSRTAAEPRFIVSRNLVSGSRESFTVAHRDGAPSPSRAGETRALDSIKTHRAIDEPVELFG